MEFELLNLWDGRQSVWPGPVTGSLVRVDMRWVRYGPVLSVADQTYSQIMLFVLFLTTPSDILVSELQNENCHLITSRANQVFEVLICLIYSTHKQ